MSEKIYWNLLVLFAVLYQGIIGTLAEEDIGNYNIQVYIYNAISADKENTTLDSYNFLQIADESSEFLVREKRVINRTPGGDRRAPIKDIPYIVFLKQLRQSEFCAGVILKPSIVLTASQCVQKNVEQYKVYSGSAGILSMKSSSVVHSVTEKKIFLGNFPYRTADGIALLTVVPHFVYSINTHNIDIYQGHIQPGSLGVVSGWGCNPMGHPGTAHPLYLRSITVPIISNQQCATLYQHLHFPISANDICTLDPTGHKYCGVNDYGDPLVIDADHEHYLVGIHIHNLASVGLNNSDVFANLQSPRYKSFILENTRSM